MGHGVYGRQIVKETARRKAVQYLWWTVIVATVYLILFRWEWKGDLVGLDIFLSTYILGNLLFTLRPKRGRGHGQRRSKTNPRLERAE
jgi:hypothetical protein